MGCPDIPGLLEGKDTDPITYSQEIAHPIQSLSVDINYVKGVVQSRVAMQGSEVEALRAKIFSYYATTVFLGKNQGTHQKGDHWEKLRFFSSQM